MTGDKVPTGVQMMGAGGAPVDVALGAPTKAEVQAEERRLILGAARMRFFRKGDLANTGHEEVQRDYNHMRANVLSDKCGELRTEIDELLRENARLRRALEKKT